MIWRRVREDRAASERRARRDWAIERLERLVGQMEHTVAELQEHTAQQVARARGDHGN